MRNKVFYNTCPGCLSNLDPGEICGCANDIPPKPFTKQDQADIIKDIKNRWRPILKEERDEI